MKEKKRLVIKVGTSAIQIDGRLSDERIGDISRQITELQSGNWDVVLVSSGAVGAGRAVCDATEENIETKQALAAIGQPELMQRYAKAFRKHETQVAQAMLTKEDFVRRESYLNVRNALAHLRASGIVPIINENDVTATYELRIGDNDRLAAYVANIIDADLFLIITTIDGLYDGNPNKKGSKLVTNVENVTEEVEAYAKGITTKEGSGGMKTKLEAAKLATASGCRVVIANIAEQNVAVRVASGEQIGTTFKESATKKDARKRWVLSREHKGAIIINACAVTTLQEGKASLLPVGIVGVKGTFKKGDSVCICSEAEDDIAHGIANYGSEETKRIMGLKSREIVKMLGYVRSEELVHKDNLVLAETAIPAT